MTQALEEPKKKERQKMNQIDLAAEILAAEESTGETIRVEQIDNLTILYYCRPDGGWQVVAIL